jgi:hypothetical protein
LVVNLISEEKYIWLFVSREYLHVREWLNCSVALPGEHFSDNCDVFNTFLRKAETKRWTTQQQT